MNITLDPLLVTLIAGAVIPVIVAFTTKAGASSGLKAIVNIVLSTVVGTLTQIVNNGGTFELKGTVVATLITLVTSLTAYNGLWKPVTGLNTKTLPNVGLGATQPVSEHSVAVVDTPPADSPTA